MGEYLALSDLKLLVVAIDDGCGWTGGTGEGDPLVVGGKLDGSLTRHCVGWVETDRVRDSTEHGKILQSHLGRTVFTCRVKVQKVKQTYFFTGNK